MNSLSHLLILKFLNKTAAVNDEGSNAMMSDFIAEQEKTMDDEAWLEE
jgi:starvation-inducible DNA-binding protein